MTTEFSLGTSHSTTPPQSKKPSASRPGKEPLLFDALVEKLLAAQR